MSQAKSIFKDKETQSTFDKDGFVKINLLNADQVSKLVSCYNKNKQEHQKVKTLHHTSTDTGSTQLIIEEDTLIKEAFTPGLDRYFADYKPLVGCFHIKEPGVGSATGMHQDPTFVDDEKYFSANIWVALQDINSENGNLFFIKGSHRVVNSLRVTPTYPAYYRSFSDRLRERATEVPLKAGEAIVFSNATIHGATDNRSSDRRMAATLLVCSKDAQWHLYYNDISRAEEPIEKYHLDFDTFISMSKDGRPAQHALQDRLDYVFPEISEAEFNEQVRSTDRPKGIYKWVADRLANLI